MLRCARNSEKLVLEKNGKWLAGQLGSSLIGESRRLHMLVSPSSGMGASTKTLRCSACSTPAAPQNIQTNKSSQTSKPRGFYKPKLPVFDAAMKCHAKTHHSKSKSSSLSRYFKMFRLILLESTHVTKSSMLRVTRYAGSVTVSVPTRTCPCSINLLAWAS